MGAQRSGRLRAALVFVALLGALLAVPNAFAVGYTVNSSADTNDGVCDVFDCTLREAINAANAAPGSAITFQIGVGGSYTISPASPLPNITAAVTIDATTQTGYAGAPLIELNGSGAGPTAAGLTVFDAAATIRGFAVNWFGGKGIALLGASGGSVIAGNYIGVNSNGAVAAGNTTGVGVSSAGNTIGGSTAADRNVISGNTGNGVEISASETTVYGNYIGLDAAGNFAVPNGGGILVGSNANTIGVDGDATKRNVVSGNSGVGIVIRDASTNTVAGNYVGTDADGSVAVANAVGGLQIVDVSATANSNTVRGNLISGNGWGVAIEANVEGAVANNTIDENLIGTDATGKNAVGNTGAGVVIGQDGGIGNNTIGGIAAGSGNEIAFNSSGIVAGANSVRNAFLHNSIHDNTGLGIDLNDDGVTANDSNDADTGANELVNFPELSTATRDSAGNVSVTGTYDGSLPGSSYGLDFYVSPSCDSSTFGEGNRWIGTISVVSNAAGDFSFDTGALDYAAPSAWVTATATDALNETSEFSQCKQLPAATGNTLLVNTNATHDDGACQQPSGGDCTLAEAINEANAVAGTDTIVFDFNATFAISPTVPLPPITDDVVIDGTSHPSYTDTPVVRLDGFDAGASTIGLSVTGGVDGSTIRGLSITGFGGGGISLGGPSSVVQGNYVGVTPAGTAAANGSASTGGIIVTSNGNRIGGTGATDPNLISGNNGAGVYISGGANNVVLGNGIGTNRAGTAALPNAGGGIHLENVGSQTIGGTAAGAGNVISGNGGNGITVFSGSDASIIQGNTIGLTLDGSSALANGGAGVLVDSSAVGARIGGAVAGAGNVISGNGGTGIEIGSSSGARIQGNVIGLDASGAAAVSNGAGNVQILSSDTIQVGGTTATARNVISGAPSGNGILLDSGSFGVTVQGNYIGTDKTGETALGNAEGVSLAGGAHDNTIGGAVPGAGNVISGSNGPGVRLDLVGTGNRILGNSIGTDKDEATTIPNDIGIELDGTAGAQIGSTSPGAGNVIAGSLDVGILFFLGSDNNTVAGNFIGTNRSDTLDLGNGTGIRFVNGGGSNNLIGPSNVIANSFDASFGYGIELDAGSGNRISANSIHDNVLRGIFLAVGANGGQAAPVLSSAVKTGATTTINGTLSTAASSSYFIEYFVTPTCTGPPQGKFYLGFQSVTTDGSGNASLSFTSNVPVAGQAITATATSSTNNTSEFSACATVTSTTDVTTSLEPDHGTTVAGGINGYTIRFDNPTAADVTLNSISATLPSGLYYVRNSAELGTSFVNPFGTQPAMTGTLTWSGPFIVPAGGFFKARFDVGVSQTSGTYTTSATADAAGGVTVVGDSAPITVASSLEGSTVIAPEADTYVNAASPGTNYGTEPSFDTYGGNNASRAGPQYGLLRFDLSAVPAGAVITGARLRLVSNSGFAFDGDPLHHAIYLRDDSWSETGVTFATRPNDNPLAVPNILVTKAKLGSDVVFYGGLGGFGDQMHLFRGPQEPAGFMSQRVAAEANGDDKLSIELFNGCCGPNGTAYWATYYSREATSPDRRPELVVSYATDSAQPGTTFTVNTDGDYTDGMCGVLDCTLREAILAANGAGGVANTIAFAIPGSAPVTIQPDSALPPITDQTTIDGSTQPGFTTDPIVVIDGSYSNADVLVLAPGSAGSRIRSLVVNQFTNHSGILLQSPANMIERSFIGTTATGLAPSVGGLGDAIEIQHSGNVIGGSPTERNVIVAGDAFGSGGTGVLINGTTTPVGNNVVAGNYIGLDKDGVHGLGGSVGVQTLGAASHNFIGGPSSGAGNVIAGVSNGIILGSLGNPRAPGSGQNDIVFNILGLQADGTSELTDAANNAGILDDAIDVWDLGSNTIADNVISKSFQGVFLINSDFNAVNRNQVGTDSSGTADRSNRSVGIAISGGVTNLIGTAGSGNLVGFNDEGGILVSSSNSNTISHNAVGTNAAGTQNLANGTTFPAIELDGGSSGNIIGPGNVVKFGGKEGIAVTGAGSVGNRITENSIDGNTRLGIDLVVPTDPATGVTPNDSLDADSGANFLQNYPVLSSATPNGEGVRVIGTLNSKPSTTYTIEFFASSTCDPAGFGEGGRFIGFSQLTTDESGSLQIDTESGLTAPVSTGEAITATARDDSTADTSEFSACVTVAAPMVTNASLNPASPNSPAGAARVKLGDVPPSALIEQQSSQQAAPVNQTPVNQTPINQTATANAPVNQTPINQTPVNQTPVNQSGFAELTQTISQLGDISIATIPLLRTGGWAALLSGTPLAGIPEQNVTLRNVYALNPVPAPLQPNATNPITIGELDLSRSPLGSLSAMAFALGKLPLSAIPTSSGGTYTDWCTAAAVQGVNCTSSTSTVMSAGLQGAPVNQTPVNQTPVNQTLIQALATYGTPINQTPVNQTPINQTRIGALPINQTPVNQTPVNQTPINQLSLQPILAANAPVNQTPVNQTPINQLSNPNDLFFCSPPEPSGPNTINCSTAVLRDAVDGRNAVRPGVTLGDLRIHAPASLLASWTIADLRYFGNMTIGDLLVSLPQPNSFTLADVLLLVLGSPTGVQGLSFEGINIFDTGLQQVATGGSTVGYRAQFTVSPNGGPTGVPHTVTVSSTVASGFLYVPGSSTLVQGTSCGATAIGDPASTTLNDGRLKLTWAVDTIVGNTYSLCFTARPGLVLGPQASSLAAQPSGGEMSTASGGVLTVGDTLEPNDPPPPGVPPELFNDSFYLSYLTSASDVDYYRFAAPPAGTVMTFHLSHLPADYDLVVYGPAGTALRPGLASSVPLDEAPVTDSGVDLTSASQTLPSQALDDLRLRTDLPMVGVSASRGTDPEDVVAISQGTGEFTVQVTGYNAATSPKPYMMRVATSPPRVTSNVPSRTVSGTVGPALPALPANLKTVFLVNRQQLEGIYGATRATNVMNALSNNSAAVAALGFPNVTLSVDRFPSVQTAYAAWNANPGNPATANGVVQAINGVIDSQIRSQPNGAGLKYLVVVGGDQVIPFARLDDFTVTANNEQGYASTFDRNSDLFASLNAGQMLSDDPLGDVNPVPYLTRQLYIPELAVGRLVETPEDIVSALNRFVSPSVAGKLDPTTSLTTGYDFLYDGAQSVNSPFNSRFGTNAKTLLDNPAAPGDSWTLQQLIGAFLPTASGTASPSISSLNGHGSHFQFEPPKNDVNGAREPLLTTSAVTGSSSSLTNRLIFSMACHLGLPVADAVVTGTTLDWPQAFAQKGAGAFLGNTGYGYGDTLVVAYSEELNKLLAQRTAAGSTVGEALSAAKQAYYGELGVFGVYDEKAMSEFTLYGLPMWKVTGPPTGGAAAAEALAAPESETLEAPAEASSPAEPAALVTDPTTGLEAETFSVDPTQTHTPHPTPDGTFWSGPEVQVTHLRPLQPKMFVGLTGTSGHGALITELTSSDTNCVNPVFARPIVDLTENERELRFGDVAFPSKLQTVRTFETPTGRAQQLVLVNGQFFTQTCSGDPDPQLGVQRLFGHIGGRVFRSSSTDFISPAFQQIQATQVEGNAAFVVDVTDKTPSGAGTVKQVLVGLRSGAATNWTFVNLAQSSGNPARWTGGAPISGSQFEYFLQAVDAAGNVAVSTNKGFYFAGAPAPPPPSGTVTATLGGAPKTNGWFTAAPTLTINKPADVTVEASVDGGQYGTPPSTITGDGAHTIDIRASNGDTLSLIAPVDTTAPEIVIGTPAAGGRYVLNSVVPADYFCRDSGSGVATPCTGTVPNGQPIDTSSVGTKTFTVQGITDVAGHSTPARTVTYTVIYRPIVFSSGRTGDGDIYTVRPDGSELTRLTSTARLDEQPAWSPDGSKIAFASDRDSAMGSALDIYVMDANGQNVTRLTTASGDDTAPSWSPDGTKIAFQSKRDGNPEIYVMNADGTAQTRLTNNTTQDAEPAWSPNLPGGEKIVFLSNRLGTLNVWVMSTSGSNQTRLTATRQPDGTPSWSPDGSKILFASKRGDNKGTVFDLYTMNSDGTNVVRLTANKTGDFEGAWSRDGLKIALTSVRNGNQEIYHMNANGSGQTRVTNNAAFDRQPDW